MNTKHLQTFISSGATEAPPFSGKKTLIRSGDASEAKFEKKPRVRAARTETPAPPDFNAPLWDATVCAAACNASIRTFYRQLRHKLPKPIRLSPRVLRWRREDVLAWLQSMPPAEDAFEPPEAFALAQAALGVGLRVGSADLGLNGTKQRGLEKSPALSNSNTAEAA